MKDPVDQNEEEQNMRATDAEFPKESSNDGEGEDASSSARKRKDKDSKKTDIE